MKRDGRDGVATLTTAPVVFVSHSSLDQDFVETVIVPLLRANGMRPWFAPLDISYTADWERRIRQGLQDSDLFIVVMSPNAAASDWVRVEVHWATEHRAGCMVPVVIEACDFDDLHLKLRQLHYIDFRREPEEAKGHLVDVLQRAMLRSVELPKPPPESLTFDPTVRDATLKWPTITFLAVEGPLSDKHFSVQLHGRVIIGRAGPMVDLPLRDAHVSRQHAALSFARRGMGDDYVWIEDLSSANGTFVNGQEIGESHPVQIGDRLEIGQSVLRVQAIELPES